MWSPSPIQLLAQPHSSPQPKPRPRKKIGVPGSWSPPHRNASEKLANLWGAQATPARQAGPALEGWAQGIKLGGAQLNPSRPGHRAAQSCRGLWPSFLVDGQGPLTKPGEGRRGAGGEGAGEKGGEGGGTNTNQHGEQTQRSRRMQNKHKENKREENKPKENTHIQTQNCERPRPPPTGRSPAPPLWEARA